ncbi:alpha/beta-hydrolase [Daedalea quercina L-15889]|uniref:Alpha/beta-hydrolase n=1 Tax=Daedalea quercina L-15889 TaxID=1314783 RepID=A0A165SVE2_9APHY|nr:alpha/beta-hydrolase [Daedalea quercina L-15889]
MGVNTFSAAVHIAPVAIKTLVQHGRKKAHKYKDGKAEAEATDDIFFDEGFHIVKAFIELGTHNAVESLQAFTNTHVPAPPWAAVAPVQIPFASCNKAADVLIDWFGPDDLEHVVGGERWWQVRGLDGIDSEWITEYKYLSNEEASQNEQPSETERYIARMEHLESVMLYVHGGAYFWGSINTHRYQIIRYARKFKGRAFAVNYRKAPQYPWPCPLQDVLAAYFYLTNPPPGALHKPVSPSKIVFAGDSAGAGLCLTALTVLRDMGIQQPAGAILISPWVDMTHSFPSVMGNTATDIIPPYGFIHKPSPTWPIHLLPDENGRARAIPTQTNPPPQPGHADTLQPNKNRAASHDEPAERGAEGKGGQAQDLKDEHVGSQVEMLSQSQSQDTPPEPSSPARSDSGGPKPETPSGLHPNGVAGLAAHVDVSPPPEDRETQGKKPKDPQATSQEDRTKQVQDHSGLDYDSGFWEPKPPKVLMDDPHARPLELRSQIQLYATNEQLTHPLVSPVLQGSLGNLCPLYIICGDGEVLRDEIIYLAHKAAHPDEYPARGGILREGRRQKENAERFKTPTKVHLQVYDGMCHVLTVFTFTRPAKYAYSSIAQFVKHVTQQPPDHLARNPFPEFHIPPEELDDSDDDSEDAGGRPPTQRAINSGERAIMGRSPARDVPTGQDDFKSNEERAKEEVKEGEAEQMPAGTESESEKQNGSGKDIPRVIMLRERVDVFGKVRPMEPEEGIPALQLKPQSIGIIKEAPVKRWLTGQDLWDKKYKHRALKMIKRRRKYEEKAERLLQHAHEQGVIHDSLVRPTVDHRSRSHFSLASAASGVIDHDRRWGPLDLGNEVPAPSAIAGRRDTAAAVALLKKNVYHTAPVTHKMVPKLKTSDVIRGAFEEQDNPRHPPPQSVSEQQVYQPSSPMHGLRIWQSLVTYFMRKSTQKAATKAAHGKDHAASALNDAGKALQLKSSKSQR